MTLFDATSAPAPPRGARRRQMHRAAALECVGNVVGLIALVLLLRILESAIRDWWRA